MGVSGFSKNPSSSGNLGVRSDEKNCLAYGSLARNGCFRFQQETPSSSGNLGVRSDEKNCLVYGSDLLILVYTKE